MPTIIVQGGTFEIPEKCADCGSRPSVFGMTEEILSLSRSARNCVFCGQLIRVTSGTWKHFHKPEVDENTWSMDTAFEYEPHWDWLEHTPYGGFDVRAHVSCAKAAMKFANFESGLSYNHPESIPEGGMPREMTLETCKQCGITPTVLDLEKVAARLYSTGFGSCVYCGKAILLRSLALTHFRWDGEHRGWWWSDNWAWEKLLHWSGWASNEKSKYITLDFYGHFDCAIKAMPYHVWLEDQARCNCGAREIKQ